jgi:hypothetical protein
MGLAPTTAAAIKQLAAQEAEQLAPLEAAHVSKCRTLQSTHRSTLQHCPCPDNMARTCNPRIPPVSPWRLSSSAVPFTFESLLVDTSRTDS